jgi:hypothetical protein
MVMELNQQSPRIPPEKEDLIEESMRRIKSIECDIKKTQRVSNFRTWSLSCLLSFSFNFPAFFEFGQSHSYILQYLFQIHLC